jgi:hypothetical protein
MTSSGLLVKLTVRNQGPLDATNVKATVVIPPGFEFTLFRKGADNFCTYKKADATVECAPEKSPLKMKDSFRYRFLVSGPFETTSKVSWKLTAKADNSDAATSGIFIR